MIPPCFSPACAVQIEQSSLESVQKQTKIKFFHQTLANTRDFVAKHTPIEQQRRLDVKTTSPSFPSHKNLTFFEPMTRKFNHFSVSSNEREIGEWMKHIRPAQQKSWQMSCWIRALLSAVVSFSFHSDDIGHLPLHRLSFCLASIARLIFTPCLRVSFFILYLYKTHHSISCSVCCCDERGVECA